MQTAQTATPQLFTRHHPWQPMVTETETAAVPDPTLAGASQPPPPQQRHGPPTLAHDKATLFPNPSATSASHVRGSSGSSSSNPPVPPRRSSSVRSRQHARPLTMPADSFASPNAIPPRTSSSAHHAHHRSKSNGVASDFAAAAGPSSPTNHKLSGSMDAAPAPAGNGLDPEKPVLKPVAEGAWLGHGPGPNGSSAETIRAVHEAASHAPTQSTTYALGTPVPPLGASVDGAAEGPAESSATANGGPAAAAAISTWTPAKEQIILGPYAYLHDRPGKNMRTALVSAFNRWLHVPPERLAIITAVVGMLHTASLLVDDIEDSAELRRGAPVAHRIFGTPQTLNSANYVYFGALRELLRLGNPKFVDIYAEELCNLHRGQGLDLYWRDTLTCPTEAEYLDMVGNKTAGLFRLAIKLMQAESESDKDFVPLVNLMGIIFQIRDDYLNLWSPAYAENKGLCEDLTEGKFSFPVIHGVRADPRNTQLLNILRQRPTDPAVKRYATDYLERVGSFAHCRAAVRGLVERAREMVAALDADAPVGPNAEVGSILDGFLLD